MMHACTDDACGLSACLHAGIIDQFSNQDVMFYGCMAIIICEHQLPWAKEAFARRFYVWLDGPDRPPGSSAASCSGSNGLLMYGM